MSIIECEGCPNPATVKCEECGSFCDKCDHDLHEAIGELHERTPLNKPATAAPAPAVAAPPASSSSPSPPSATAPDSSDDTASATCEACPNPAVFRCEDCCSYLCQPCFDEVHPPDDDSHQVTRLESQKPHPAPASPSSLPTKPVEPVPAPSSSIEPSSSVSKSASEPPSGPIKCQLCEEHTATIRCDECDRLMCADCDSVMHDGEDHIRKTISSPQAIGATSSMSNSKSGTVSSSTPEDDLDMELNMDLGEPTKDQPPRAPAGSPTTTSEAADPKSPEPPLASALSPVPSAPASASALSATPVGMGPPATTATSTTTTGLNTSTHRNEDKFDSTLNTTYTSQMGSSSASVVPGGSTQSVPPSSSTPAGVAAASSSFTSASPPMHYRSNSVYLAPIPPFSPPNLPQHAYSGSGSKSARSTSTTGQTPQRQAYEGPIATVGGFSFTETSEKDATSRTLNFSATSAEGSHVLKQADGLRPDHGFTRSEDRVSPSRTVLEALRNVIDDLDGELSEMYFDWDAIMGLLDEFNPATDIDRGETKLKKEVMPRCEYELRVLEGAMRKLRKVNLSEKAASIGGPKIVAVISSLAERMRGLSLWLTQTRRILRARQAQRLRELERLHQTIQQERLYRRNTTIRALDAVRESLRSQHEQLSAPGASMEERKSRNTVKLPAHIMEHPLPTSGRTPLPSDRSSRSSSRSRREVAYTFDDANDDSFDEKDLSLYEHHYAVADELRLTQSVGRPLSARSLSLKSFMSRPSSGASTDASATRASRAAQPSYAQDTCGGERAVKDIDNLVDMYTKQAFDKIYRRRTGNAPPILSGFTSPYPPPAPKQPPSHLVNRYDVDATERPKDRGSRAVTWDLSIQSNSERIERGTKTQRTSDHGTRQSLSTLSLPARPRVPPLNLPTSKSEPSQSVSESLTPAPAGRRASMIGGTVGSDGGHIPATSAGTERKEASSRSRKTVPFDTSVPRLTPRTNKMDLDDMGEDLDLELREDTTRLWIYEDPVAARLPLDLPVSFR